jgi:hypothetical protein
MKFFDRLDDCINREYVAIEAETHGYGGFRAVCRAFGMSIATIRKGV